VSRDGVAIPPVPPKPFPGAMAGPGLVAFVAVSKFADHLPLYRLEDILTRHGVYLSRSTLCDWVRDVAVVLEPLAELQKALVLQSPVIWTDDTPVTVLGGDEPGSSTGRFRVYIGDDQHP
jgi:transposase